MAGWSDAVTEIFRFLNNIFTSPKKQIMKVIRIYDAMHKVIQETNVERFMVFKAHNGGGVINPTGNLYVSVIYEDYDHPFVSMKDNYQKLSVDVPYAKILVEVIQYKKIDYNTEQMPDCILRQIYVNEGVKRSFIYYLGQDRKNIYFCSCATSHEQIERKILVDVGVNIIKQNIK